MRKTLVNSALMLLLVVAAFGGPVTNSSFDEAGIVNNTGNLLFLANGSTLGAWNIISPQSSIQSNYTVIQTPNTGISGFQNTFFVGSESVLLNADGQSTVAISQTVSGLTIGQLYIIKFFLADESVANLGPSNSAPANTHVKTLVDWGAGNTTVTRTGTGWNFVAVPFTATTTSITLKLQDASDNFPGFFSSLVDGVSVDQAPEPATFALLGAGLVGLLIYRRRSA